MFQGDHTRVSQLGRIIAAYRDDLPAFMPSSKRLRRSYTLPTGQSVARTRSTRKYRGSKYMKPVKSYNSYIKAVRSVRQNIVYNPSGGWGGALGTPDLSFAFQLGTVEFAVGGPVAYTQPLPSVSEFTNLFDEYRIARVKFELHYSFANGNSGATYPYPVLNVANDLDSYGASFNLDDMNQYPNKKTFQCIPGQPITWSVRPVARADVLTNTGITSSSAAASTAWISTSSNNIRHLGTRMWLDNCGRATNVDLGTFTIYVSYELEFRGMR